MASWHRSHSQGLPRGSQDLITFNATLSSLEKCHQWQRGVALLEAMASWRLQPDVISFNASISSLVICCGKY